MQMPNTGRGSRRTIFAKRSQFACSLSRVGSNLMAGSFPKGGVEQIGAQGLADAGWLAFGRARYKAIQGDTSLYEVEKIS
jgi:hypothetical protein